MAILTQPLVNVVRNYVKEIVALVLYFFLRYVSTTVDCAKSFFLLSCSAIHANSCPFIFFLLSCWNYWLPKRHLNICVCWLVLESKIEELVIDFNQITGQSMEDAMIEMVENNIHLKTLSCSLCDFGQFYCKYLTILCSQVPAGLGAAVDVVFIGMQDTYKLGMKRWLQTPFTHDTLWG